MKYRIVYCIPSLHLVGGMERALTLKANYFSDIKGYQITIITTDGGEFEPFFPLSPKIEVINLNINFEKYIKYPLYLKSLVYINNQRIFKSKLKQILYRIRPHYTITMLRREINFINSIDDGSIKIGEMQFNYLNYRKISKIPLSNLISKIWLNQFTHKIEKLKCLVVLSERDCLNYPKRENIVVIPNPIKSIPLNQCNYESKKVIAAGRFSKQKGFDLLLQSWKIVSKKFPDWTLSIYGQGEKDEYITYIKNNNLESNCFIYEQSENIEEKICDSSIFAFSSRFEGFSLMLTEAMACGAATVSYDCNYGPREIIQNNISGLLIEPENTEQFADGLTKLMSDITLRESLGNRARERAKEFTIEKISEKWIELFQSLDKKVIN